MLTDDQANLLVRLREMAGYKYQYHTIHAPAVMNAAADEIERLRGLLRDVRLTLWDVGYATAAGRDRIDALIRRIAEALKDAGTAQSGGSSDER